MLFSPLTVIPTQVGIQKKATTHWMPAFAGMTGTYSSNR